jgi:hypothetical protein
VGIYLPLELGVAILTGGLVAWAAARATRQAEGSDGHTRAILFAAGLITGEAMLGILLAVPIAVCGGRNPLDLHLPGGPLCLPGLALMLLMLLALYAVATHHPRKGGNA